MFSIGGPSLHLGRIAGIPIKVHWTFNLLLLFLAYIIYSQEVPAKDLIWFFSYIILLFVFVIMHEYGHALTARRYGVKTRDIIISPIGGIARLEQLPENPKQELNIALAGPLVNVVIAGFLTLTQVFLGNPILPVAEGFTFGTFSDFLGYLLIINIVLVVFNMLPAFPMDGGRVLRALLTMGFKDRMRATKWSVRIGQAIALGFVVTGIIWDHYMLLFVGIFVFLTARAEFRQMQLLERMKASKVMDIMRRSFTVLNPRDTIQKASEIQTEKNFLVANDDQITIGTLPSQFVEDAMENDRGEMKVEEIMMTTFGSIQEETSLASAFKILNDRGWAIAQVIDRYGNKKGVIDRQLLLDFIQRR